uniref:Uncharacterized protein n=2 Tax=Alexandrium monilatum TaxID=311494 RepID=A0A7S4SJR2_9DINO
MFDSAAPCTRSRCRRRHGSPASRRIRSFTATPEALRGCAWTPSPTASKLPAESFRGAGCQCAISKEEPTARSCFSPCGRSSALWTVSRRRSRLSGPGFPIPRRATRFTEAIALDWIGLDPTRYTVTYTVEWKPSDLRMPGPGGGHTMCKFTSAHVTGLPAGKEVRVRVLACIPNKDPTQAPLRLNGPWHDVETLPPKKESELPNLDPLGSYREGCAASGCKRYVAPQESEEYVNNPNMTLCCRCGRAFMDHSRQGEEQGVGARKAGAGKFRTSAKGLDSYGISKNDPFAKLSTSAPAMPYTVVFKAVLVRSEPSVKGEKIGVLYQDQVVNGHVHKGWSMLTEATCNKARGQEFYGPLPANTEKQKRYSARRWPGPSTPRLGGEEFRFLQGHRHVQRQEEAIVDEVVPSHRRRGRFQDDAYPLLDLGGRPPLIIAP